MKGLLDHFATRFGSALLCLVLLSAGCAAQGEGFAIYLTKGDITPQQMAPLSHVETADEPVITTSDIVSYDVSTHTITLTVDAFRRIESLEVPVRGKSFVVCVDKRPIYWGAFWTPISSLSFDGVTILKRLGSQDPQIEIELGYPGSSFYQGADPRINPEVVESLKKAGKLTGGIPAKAVDRLPRSMKGYELYSWLKDGEWQFTLTTGTNRNKTLEEIISDENTVSGWVHVHVAGAEAIKSVLSRLPRDEEVFWLSGLRTDQAAHAQVSMALPPAPITDSIKDHAGRCGLHFHVQQP